MIFRPQWVWPEVEWNVISSPQNGKGHMWSQSDIISNQNIYKSEKRIYDVCINTYMTQITQFEIYLKLGDLGHMSVSCVSGFLSEWDFEKFIWWYLWQCQWWYSKLSRGNLIWFVDFLVFCVLFWILLFCWKELGGNLRGRERSGLIWIDLHLPAVARHSAYWAVVGDVVVDVVEVGGVLALLLLLHPLCILRRNKGGGVTRLDREGGVSVWGEIETAKSSNTDSPWSGPPWR